jgi:tRNA nucleotidyltransferase/poly(A) polymerase
MYEDSRGEIHDFYQGQEDLKNGILRFVGDPEARIKEDYLRILRLFRFWSRYGFQPAEQGLVACRQLRAGIKQLSQERITSELLQILAGTHIGMVLPAMVSTQVWNECLPIEQKSIDSACIAEIHTPQRLGLARLISILLQIAPSKPMELARQLRLDNFSIAAINAGCRLIPQFPDQQSSPAERMAWLDEIESKGFKWLDFFGPIALHTPGIDKTAALAMQVFEERYGNQRRTPLPITGKDLKDLGAAPGPEFGRVLEILKTEFRNQTWRTKEEGIARAKELLNTAF